MHTVKLEKLQKSAGRILSNMDYYTSFVEVLLVRKDAQSSCVKDPGKKAFSVRGNRVVSESFGYGQ